MHLSSRKFLFFLLIMISITSFLPIVHQNLPFPFGSFRFFWGPVWFISLLRLRPKAIKNRLFLMFFFYGLIIISFQYLKVFWRYSSDRQNLLFLEEIYFILTAVSIFSFFEEYKEFQLWRRFVKITLIFIGITGVMTIISSAIDPMYSRFMTDSSSGFSKTAQGQLFKRLGGGLYSYGQSIVLLLPGLIYSYKQYVAFRNIKNFLLIYIVLIFLVTLRMQFFANILTASILIFLAILGRKRLNISIVLLLISTVLLIIIPTHYYASILSFFADFFNPESQNFYKITDMSEFLVYGEIDDHSATGSRAYRYVLLYDDFKKNPAFGYLSYSDVGLNFVGFHLHFMWKLTLYGFVMFVYYIVIHYSFIKDRLRELKSNSYTYYFIVAILGYFILGSMKTVIGRDFWIVYFVLLPGFNYLVKKPNVYK